MDRPAIDQTAQPHWMRTGYKYFPYAAWQSGQWWVLRLNHGFPEHDLYSLFVDGTAIADITGNPSDPSPLVASVASLKPYSDPADQPALDAETATKIVNTVARYVSYGSEHNDPCISCSGNHDAMTGS
nr:hypothetical protein [Mycobacterium pseudoshottsii]